MIFLFYFFIFSLKAEIQKESKALDTFFLEAKELSYNQLDDLILCKDNASVQTIDRVLKADSLIYNRSSGWFEAYGHGFFQDEFKNRLWFKKMTLNQKLEKGEAKKIFMYLEDGSKLKASSLKRFSNQNWESKEAWYTPCNLCQSSSPLWSLKAEKVVHNKDEIKYKNAIFQLKNVPIAYTPYFFHPSPSIKRKSGLLIPRFNTSKDLGFYTVTPYYQIINDHQDLTFSPLVASKNPPLWTAEYRNRFHNGEAKILGSYGHSHQSGKYKKQHWLVRSSAEKHINSHYRFKMNINQASDLDYPIRYPIEKTMPFLTGDRNLTSAVSFERFFPNTYGTIESLWFQTEDQKKTPYVLPNGRFYYQGDADHLGGFWANHTDLLVLKRSKFRPEFYGTQMDRFSNEISWSRPAIYKGNFLLFSFSQRVTGYHTKNYQNTPGSLPKKTNSLTLFPRASTQWSYPLIKRTSNFQWLIEPRALLTTAPPTFNSHHIPNEDCQITEQDENNIFLPDRFQGIDRFDVGTRGTIGIHQKLYNKSHQSFDLFLGSTGTPTSNFSPEYIASSQVRLRKWLGTRHRFALDRSSFKVRYGENGISLGEETQLSFAHVFLNKGFYQHPVSQLNLEIKSNVTENWSFSLAQILNFKKPLNFSSRSLKPENARKPLQFAHFAFVRYENECFSLDAGLFRTQYHNRSQGLIPDKGFLFTLSFKNLGSLGIASTDHYPGSLLTKFSH